MKMLLKSLPTHLNPVDGDLKNSLTANSILKPAKLSSQAYQDLINFKRERQKKETEQKPLFFLIGLSVSLLLTVIVFNWKSYDNNNIVDLGQVGNDFEEVLDVPVSTQPPPPPPKQMEQFNINAVDDEEIVEEIEINLDVEMTEDMALQDVVYDYDLVVEQPEEKAEEIFQIVEDHPAYPGGTQEFYKYVAENIRYPELATRLDISGRVFVRFVIEKDGTPTQVEVIKGIGGGCDEEAIRVIQNSPRWIPGKQRGLSVRVYMTVPINFTLITR